MNLASPTDYLGVFKPTTRVHWDWATPLALVGLSLIGLAFIYSAPFRLRRATPRGGQTRKGRVELQPFALMLPAMTTTVNVTPKGQMELPQAFRTRKKIAPGTALRVTEVGEGLYVTPVPEPTEKELRAVVAAAGTLTRRQTPEDEILVRGLIADYRSAKRPQG